LTKTRAAFLLGAGASKPAPSNIPTVKELLPQLLERGRRLDREDVTKLAAFCEERRIDNIEDLLTAAQLATFSSRNPIILRLLNYLLYGGEAEGAGDEMVYRRDPSGQLSRARKREPAVANVSSVAFLQDTLQVLFGLLASTMLPAEPNKAHEAIANFTKTYPLSTIVTTNYDCCMDLALEAAQLPVTYRLEFANRTNAEVAGSAPLVKLHGSLNWYYCETCQEVQCVDIRSTVENYKQGKAPYAVIAICKDCGGQRRGLLVPPLAMKFDVAPPLTPLLAEAREAFERADVIVVVGFSFAEADVYISRMLSKSMQTRPSQRLIIIDPISEVVSRVRRKFKSSIPNFEERRIIRITGDCSEALPKLLNGGYLADQTTTEKVAATDEAASVR
jgi:NAD-dependent SIR2 family protein deacetylase